MRVLITADAVGGVWSYAIELARALRGRGVELSLATLGPPPSEAQRREAAEAGFDPIHESSYALEWMPAPWKDVEESGEWLLDLAAVDEVDVVHLNSFSHGALSWPVPALVVGHSCVCSWWNAVHGEDPPRDWARYRREVAAGLAGADEVVAPTMAMLRELARHYGRSGGRVIANGIEQHDGPVAPKEPFVLAAGRLWDGAKNLATLGRAALGLSWPVLAAGAVQGRAPEGVEALGRISRAELLELRRRAAIFAAPARYEPFGLAALEAGSEGCALVLGDIDSLREVWDDAALYVDPDDPQALRGLLERLIDDDEGRRGLAERSRERAWLYSAERMGAEYMRLYGSMREKQAVAA